MKLFPLIFTLTLAALAFQTQAQPVEAEINNKRALVLPSGEPAEMYTFDLSSFQFDNASEAIEYFKEFNTEEAFIRPIPEKNIGVLHLNLQKFPDRNLSEWNAILSERPLLSPTTKPAESRGTSTH